MKALAVVWVVWVVCGLAAAGGLNADFQANYCEPYDIYNKNNNFGRSMFLGLLFGPAALFTTTFMTDFFKHGWTLSRECPT
jgi:hypothetical protein